MLLEQQVADETKSRGRGRQNPILTYSARQLRQATNKFTSEIYQTDFDFKWYKGKLDDRLVLIKKAFSRNEITYVNSEFRDITLSSQMNHKNILKLLGNCVEFPNEVVLVYEYPEYGLLNAWGGIGEEEGSSLSWTMRLSIAKDIANAIAYLHNAFSRPIIHRNIKPTSVFLDKDFVAKLSNFSISTSIPEGESEAVEMLAGTVSYIEPEYMLTGTVTRYTDVYSFGVFLLVLLTGQPPRYSFNPSSSSSSSSSSHDDDDEIVEREQFSGRIDPKILEVEEGLDQVLKSRQLQAFQDLANLCRKTRGERPSMIDVAKKLVEIENIQYEYLQSPLSCLTPVSPRD
ncbi:hypothetical protein UlMin_033751 [Ulmus minor]